MRIALAQHNYHIGHFDYNTDCIISTIRRAEKEKADLVVFAELAVSGYPPRDFLEYRDFLERCTRSLEKIASSCRNIAAIVGCPVPNPDIKGKNLFNAACFLWKGKIWSTHHKALLPTYDVFDEYRYFEPGRSFSCVEYLGKKLAITVCEDLWNVTDDPMYVLNPMDELVKSAPDMIITIAASPFIYLHA